MNNYHNWKNVELTFANSRQIFRRQISNFSRPTFSDGQICLVQKLNRPKILEINACKLKLQWRCRKRVSCVNCVEW